jgi:chemotaxis protein MotB
MKKPVVILLSILLAVAVIILLLGYRQYTDTKDAVLTYERKLFDLDERIIQLNQVNTALREQVRESFKHLEELQRAQHRISELENTIESLSNEIASSHAMITELRKQLKDSQFHISQLKDEIQKEEGELESLRSQMFNHEKQKDEANVLIGQLKSRHDSVVSELSKVIQNRDHTIVELRENLETETSWADDLKEKLRKAQGEIKSLEGQTSALRKQKRISEPQVKQMKSGYEAAVTELNQEIRKRDLRIAELENKFQETQSETNTLKDKIKEAESGIEDLEQRISKLFGEKNLLKTQMDQLKSTHASMVSELKNEVKKKEVTIEELEDKLTITFVDRILFEFGKANISPGGREILTRVGKILKNAKDKKIRVVGHTDNVAIMKEYRYKFPSNWELSAARAAAVVRHFQEEIGIDPENLEAVGHSFYDPVATNETEEGRAQNRRVNIVIAPKIE